MLSLATRGSAESGYLTTLYHLLIDVAKAGAPWGGADRTLIMHAAEKWGVSRELRDAMCAALNGVKVHSVDYKCEECGGGDEYR